MHLMLLVVLAATMITGLFNPIAEAGVNRPVRITEVYVSPPGSFVGSQKVELTNLSNESVDLGGWCLRANNLDRVFPLGTVLLPGAVFTIHIGSWGHNNNANYYTGDDFPSLRRFWDSIEIHMAGTDFETPELLADYVMWGGPHHANVALAVEAGIWKLGDFLPAILDAGDSFQYCDREQESSSAWGEGPSSVGTINTCLLVPTPVETTTWGKVKARYSN